MKRDVSLFIKDIFENIERIEGFTAGMSFKDFLMDEKTIFAIIRCIEIIGEAAKHVPEEIRQRYSQIPWRDMASMRDKLIHAYFGVNVEMVWLQLSGIYQK